MRWVGLVVLVGAFAVAAPAQAAISDCDATQVSEAPGAGGSAFFFLSCAGLQARPAYSVRTRPAHGAVSDVNDLDGDGAHGGLFHLTYTADDDAWGLTDHWVMHVEDGVDPDGADFPVSIAIAAAPYCLEVVAGRAHPLPTWTVENGRRLAAQLICSYGGSDDVTSLSVKRQAAHGLAWIEATDGGPSAPRLRYSPRRGFHGTDHFVLSRAIRVPVRAGKRRLRYAIVARDRAGNRSRLVRGKV